ncbi:hypothetical protein AVEN_150721-1, partial [Araneus ventricosus]
AVFRTSGRGARLVSRDLEGTSNLIRRTSLFQANCEFTTLVREGASKQFCACGLIMPKSATAPFTPPLE